MTVQKLSAIGQRVFDSRCAQKDDAGRVIETFEQAVYRLAQTAASVEKDKNRWEKKFADILGNLLFIPSTPIWANMGKPDRPWQPGACFVLGVEDSLESMYQTLKDSAMVFESGGGVGYNFSTIRPKGSLVHSTKGKASGVVELIKLYDVSSNMVMQGGVRRGASMGILNIDHPEIIDFIKAKLNGGLTNFNLSVGITDAFMEALVNGLDWELKFNGRVHSHIAASELWQIIIDAAHRCGDPGLIFLDRLQEYSAIPVITVNCTNPCGEQPLSPGESCLLGSINLASMMKPEGELNRELLQDTVDAAVRFLDNLIDVAEYPLPQIDAATKASRKIGLGYTGLHDALIKAGLSYDSKEGRAFAGEITQLLQQAAHNTSGHLAQVKDTFPLWEKSIYYPDDPRRNAACITIAPTGSVTTLAGCEGYGVEPIFAVAYTKTTNVVGDFEVFSPLFLKACQKHGVSQEVLTEVAKQGSCQGIAGIPKSIAAVFKGAQDIAYQDHILMQAQVQKYVDNAVSKTINLPGTATVSDIDCCYRMAYELKLKGITVFRDGCKQGAISQGQKTKVVRGYIKPRPKSASGTTHRLDTGCGKLYLTVNYDEQSGEILETFVTTGSDGGCLIYTEATSRLISLALRGGIPIEQVIEQLQSTHACPAYQFAKGRGGELSPGKSCASAIANKLSELLAGRLQETKGVKLKCELCGAEMNRAEGCYVCTNCGYSKC